MGCCSRIWRRVVTGRSSSTSPIAPGSTPSAAASPRTWTRILHQPWASTMRDADQELVRACWVLMLAMVAAWRWDRRDQFPDRRRMGTEFINEIRTALDGEASPEYLA